MTSKRDDTHLPEPQKGAITSKREAVKLELQKGGREEGSRQGGPTQMGEVQRLVMKWSLITIAIRMVHTTITIPITKYSTISITNANNTIDITIIKNTITIPITNAKNTKMIFT